MKSFTFLSFGIGVSLLAVAASSCSSNPELGANNPVAAQLAAVAVTSPATQPTASTPDRVGELPVIVHLERRNQTITIKAGPSGAVYTVTDRHGRFLHQDLSERELRAKAPDLHQFIKTAIGSNRRLKGNDARLWN